MITLQTPIPPTAAANAARGDVNGAEPAGGAEPAPGPDFAALMAEMLPVSTNPGTAATVGASQAEANTADANADTERADQEQLVDAANGAAAAIESAIAIALPAQAPVNAAAAGFPAPIRGQGAASALAGSDLPRSNAAPARTDSEAPRARRPIAEFHAPSRQATPAAAATTAADEPKALVLPLDASAHESVHASDLPQLAPPASDSVQPARQPELQAPQQASRAAETLAAPAANSPRIDAPLGSARWREDLAGHITVLVRNAASEAEIRVTPPELGPIQARISVDNGIASVALSAPVSETRDALEAALTTLRERLAESGLTLGEASVSGGRTSRDASGGERSPRAADAANPSGPLLATDPVRRLRLEGLVDLYA